jgi:excisionase family DNA binding protein
MRLMSVRATAEALGVHENTVRNWEARGILRATRLPGSGFRRFSEEEIHAMVGRMQASFTAHTPDPGEPEDVFVAGVYDRSLDEQD